MGEFKNTINKGHMYEVVPALELFNKENVKTKNQIKAIMPVFYDVIHNINDQAKVKLYSMIEELEMIDEHFKRKEKHLFPYLEKYGVNQPTSTMWQLDDEIRQGLKYVKNLLLIEENLQLEEVFETVIQLIEEMIDQEENKLYPLAVKLLSEDDWMAMDEEMKGQHNGMAELKDMPVEVLRHLPFQTVLINKEGVITNYVSGTDPITEGSNAMVGRKFYNCYPPKLATTFKKLVDEFKFGLKDKEDFWISLEGKKVLFRYYAIRDEQGHYNGAMEVAQNITPIQAMRGEKTLLQHA